MPKFSAASTAARNAIATANSGLAPITPATLVAAWVASVNCRTVSKSAAAKRLESGNAYPDHLQNRSLRCPRSPSKQARAARKKAFTASHQVSAHRTALANKESGFAPLMPSSATSPPAQRNGLSPEPTPSPAPTLVTCATTRVSARGLALACRKRVLWAGTALCNHAEDSTGVAHRPDVPIPYLRLVLETNSHSDAPSFSLRTTSPTCDWY